MAAKRPDERPAPGLDELKRAVLEDRQAREKACGEELEALLKKHRVRLLPRVSLIGDRVVPEVLLQAED